MSFCTLTFKRKIFLSLFLVCCSFLLLDLTLYIAVDQKTTKSTYISSDKQSKSKFFKLNEPYEKNIIFVGSSRTHYHISTSIFKNENINIFNFGVVGNKIEDYPDIISTIKNYNPQKVVISFRVNRVYEQLSEIKNPTLIDLKYYFKADKEVFLSGLLTYIKNFHKFFTYSEAIYNMVISFYSKFDASGKDKAEKYLNEVVRYSDCEIFKVKSGGAVECSNGDGILFGNNILENHHNSKIELKDINKKTILFITDGIIKPLIEKNIDVTIVFEPVFNNSYSYDINEIIHNLENVKIIDLMDMRIAKEKWADDEHLNEMGRDFYSRYLIELYKRKIL